MRTVSDDQLLALTGSIVSTLDPVAVILFGSQASGTAHEDSDVDLLIIDDKPFGRTRSRRATIVSTRRRLPRIGVPIDLLVFDTTEAARWRDTTNHVIATAYQEGRVLYERSGSCQGAGRDGSKGPQGLHEYVGCGQIRR